MNKKKKGELKLSFAKNTVLADATLEAFTNDFVYYDDNYFQKDIGGLFGIIQVLDHSEQSEYIPNLLTNLIKKEFYSQPKRSTEESFEAGLKKANLALADLAEHDILKWNNNLHALVGVFKENTLYFTQVGLAKIFLGREGKIIDLSEPNPPKNIHPVKTFKDVVVGEIQAGDKIIIATPTLQQIFKYDDLSRLFSTFSPQEFDDLFAKTVQKEGQNLSALIINVKKEEKKPEKESLILGDEKVTVEELTKNKNFLGGEIKTEAENDKDKEKRPKEKKSAKLKKGNSPSEKELSSDTKILKKEKEDKKETKKENRGKKGKSLQTKTVSQKEKSIKKRKGGSQKEKTNIPATRTNNPPLNKTPQAKFTKEKEKTKKEKVSKIKKEKTATEISKPKTPTISTAKAIGGKKEIKKLDDLKPREKKQTSAELSPFEEMPEIYINGKDDDTLKKGRKKIPTVKLKKYFTTQSGSTTETASSEKNEQKRKKRNLLEKSTLSTKPPAKTLSKTSQKSDSSFNNKLNALKESAPLLFAQSTKKLRQYFSDLKFDQKHIKTTLNKFNPSKSNGKNYLLFLKKHYLIIVLLMFLIFVPLFFKNRKEKTSSLPTRVMEENKTIPATPAVKNKTAVKTLSSLPENVDLLAESDTVILTSSRSGKFYEIKKENGEKKELSIPAEMKIDDIQSLVYMPSLNLFFLSGKKGVISYSPATKKFYRNKINLPANIDIIAQGVYLDYLYLLDKTTGQIYRYPRANGGFGAKKDWLRTPLKDTNKISGLAVDDNIRITYLDGRVEKYFKNKIISTKKFNTQKLSGIYTGNELKNYYLLDTSSGKILQIDKSNDSLRQEYQNEALTKTNNFTIDEKRKKIYFTVGKDVLSISLKP